MRPSPTDKGIYGMMTQLTVTGPYVNKTLFEQAKVPLPGPKATWDDWAAATRQVAKATQTPYAMAFDRSGHRFAGTAISQGAKIFDAKGNLVIDDGYKAMAKKLYDWNRDGTMPKEVWGGVGGSTYRDAFEEFANGRVVLYLSGSWQIKRMETQIGKNFDWIVVPNPCGPGACIPLPRIRLVGEPLRGAQAFHAAPPVGVVGVGAAHHGVEHLVDGRERDRRAAAELPQRADERRVGERAPEAVGGEVPRPLERGEVVVPDGRERLLSQGRGRDRPGGGDDPVPRPGDAHLDRPVDHHRQRAVGVEAEIAREADHRV
jgi:hypothetical protein